MATCPTPTLHGRRTWVRLAVVAAWSLSACDGSGPALGTTASAQGEARQTPAADDPCDALKRCLRGKLPSRYRRERDGKRLAEAESCLSGVSEQERFRRKRCLPMQLGHNAADGRPLEIMLNEGRGCVVRDTNEMMFRYAPPIDEPTCHCIGWPAHGSGLSTSYMYCVPAAAEHLVPPRGDAAMREITWRPFGTEEQYWNNLSRLDVVPLGAKRGRTPRQASRRDLRSLGGMGVTQKSGRRFEVEYRVASIATLSRLLPAATMRDLLETQRDLRGSRGQSEHEATLEWWVAGQKPFPFHDDARVLRATLPTGLADVARLRRELEALPRPQGCPSSEAQELPFGGPDCQPGLAAASFVGMREGDRAIRAITPAGFEALCATLRSGLPHPKVVVGVSQGT